MDDMFKSVKTPFWVCIHAQLKLRLVSHYTVKASLAVLPCSYEWAFWETLEQDDQSSGVVLGAVHLQKIFLCVPLGLHFALTFHLSFNLTLQR